MKLLILAALLSLSGCRGPCAGCMYPIALMYGPSLHPYYGADAGQPDAGSP